MFTLLILAIGLAAVSSYEVGRVLTLDDKITTTTITATTTKTVTSFYVLPAGNALRAVVFKDDFLFQIQINKTEYRYDEPITVYFNLTYVGQSNRTVNIPNLQFEISILNATQHNLVDTIAIPAISRHNFSFGKSITGIAVIDNGFVRYYPVGANAGFTGFKPNSVYLIESTANGLALTAPPLTLFITERQ